MHIYLRLQVALSVACIKEWVVQSKLWMDVSARYRSLDGTLMNRALLFGDMPIFCLFKWHLVLINLHDLIPKKLNSSLQHLQLVLGRKFNLHILSYVARVWKLMGIVVLYHVWTSLQKLRRCLILLSTWALLRCLALYPLTVRPGTFQCIGDLVWRLSPLSLYLRLSTICLCPY